MKSNALKILILTFVTLFVLNTYLPMKSLANGLEQTINDCIGEKKDCTEAEQSNNQKQVESMNASTKISFFDGVRMIAALAFVIFLLYAILKFVNKRNITNQSNQLIKNLGGTSLGGKNSVQIVKIGNEIYILGIGEEVRLIKEITDEKVVEQYIEKYEEQLVSMNQPIDTLKKWLDTRKNHLNEEKQEKTFQSQLNEQLLEIKESRKKAMEKLHNKEKHKNE